jgi:hypothetical protein
MAKQPNTPQEREPSRRPARIPRRKVAPEEGVPATSERKSGPDECEEIGPQGGYGGAGPDQEPPQG